MMNRVQLSLVAVALAGLSASASAQNYYDGGYADGRGGSSVGYDFARVVEVQPVYDDVSYAQPREVCWNEPVTYTEQPRYTRYERNRSGTPEIVGGIIGGLIGNQFGSGNGRAAATVAGVALGASVARDNQRYRGGYYESYGPSYERTVNERRCQVRDDYRSERRLVGYDVTYDYNGTIGHTFSERQPGTEIRVRVAVEPAD